MPPIDDHDMSVVADATEKGLRIAEDVLYAFIALLLVAGSFVVLVEAAVSLATTAWSEPHKAIEKTLDALLIGFILVELLSAVRETLRKRQLVAEPFLLVGIIASIKEIVVIGAFAESKTNVPETMLQIGVLGGVVLALCIALLLLRRKEREPVEADEPTGDDAG